MILRFLTWNAGVLCKIKCSSLFLISNQTKKVWFYDMVGVKHLMPP